MSTSSSSRPPSDGHGAGDAAPAPRSDTARGQAGSSEGLLLHLDRLGRLKRTVGWTTLLVGLPAWVLGEALLAVATEQARQVDSAVASFLLSRADGERATLGWLLLLAAFALWRMLAWRIRELRRRGADPDAQPRHVPFFSLRLVPTLAALGIVLWHVPDGLTAWLAATLELAEASSPLPHWAQWMGLDRDGYAARLASAAGVLGWAHVALAVACGLVAGFCAHVDRALAPEAKGLAAWFRLAAWYGLGWAAWLLAPRLVQVGWLDADALAWIEPALRGLEIVIGVEIVLRVAAAIWMRFYDGHEPPGARILTDAIVPRLLGSHPNPVRSVFDVAAESFGIDLRGTYALVFMRRALVPLSGALVVCAWIASAFCVVPTQAVGVLERFGARPDAGGLLEPGLHLLAPWPIDRVRLVETDRVHVTPIGFERSIAGETMLWSEQHAEGEYRLVLGDGNELLSVNAVLHWRPADPIAFAYGTANPEQALSDLAHRVLYENTVDRTLEEVLSGNLEALTDEFEQQIVDAVERSDMGIEVVDLVVFALHPPKDVAPDYQDVVSKQIDGERLVVQAEAGAVQDLFDAEARAFRTVAEAEAGTIEDVAFGLGRVEAFELLMEHRGDAERDGLFALLLYLEHLERALVGRPFVVWHRRLDEDGANLWILDR